MKVINIKGVRKVGRAACELAWGYFNNDKMPDGVLLLGKYDTWRKGREGGIESSWSFDDAKAINTFYKYKVSKFPSSVLSHIIDSTVSTIENTVAEGENILEIYNDKCRAFAKAYSFVYSLKLTSISLNVLFMNSNERSSSAFEGVYDEDLHDLMCCYFYDGSVGKWIHSFYSTKKSVDASEVAKLYGGGGHAGAAGCQLDAPIIR